MTNPKFRNYEQVQRFFMKCRTPDKGRQVNACCRVFVLPDGTYQFKFYNTPVFTISPSNILTFIVDGKNAYSTAVSTSATMHRIVPLAWTRKRHKVYQVGRSDIPWQDREWVELFNGLQFDLEARKFTNAKLPMLERIDKDKNLEWKRAITRFKRGLRVRVKLGAVKAITDNIIAKEFTDTFKRPDWDSEEWQNLLLDSIVKGEYPIQLLEGFARSNIRISYWGSRRLVPNPEEGSTIDNILSSTSISLRTKFGVFVD